jgi:opacity protein-like surface antigen
MCRLSLLLAIFLGLASPAVAEDFPYPPISTIPPAPPGPPRYATVGPATFTRWSGFYFGGQFGLGNGNADFSGATQGGVAYTLRNTYLESDFTPSQWPVLGTANTSALSYGGFVGYNTQWQDLILGIELNINYSTLSLNAPNSPLSRTTSADSAGDAYALLLSGAGSVTNIDTATLRARAGYVVGSFLPYGFAGPAVALANVSVSSTLSGIQYTSGTVGTCSGAQPCTPFSFTSSSVKNMEVLYGFAVGAGVDIAVTQNIFVRAEVEWDQFNPPPGILMTIATARVGAGLKF